MESPNPTNSLVYFFNDIIGTIVPGFILLIGFKILNIKYEIIEIPNLQLDNSLQIISIITLSYILGHGILGFYQFSNGFLKFNDYEKEKNDLKQEALYQDLILCYKERFSNIAWLSSTIDPQKFSPNQIRNIAMTISKEGQSLSVRFMFISLLCMGVATSLFILLLVFVISHYLKYQCAFISVKFVLLFAGVAFAIFIFHDRGKEFSKRSFRTPFATALTELMLDKKNEKSE